MEVRFIRSIRRAKKYFDGVTPEHSFQSYAVQCAIEKSIARGWLYSFLRCPWGTKITFTRSVVVVDDAGKPILLAPVRFVGNGAECHCSGATYGSTADYIDFLYADVPESLRVDAFKVLVDWLRIRGCRTVHFEQMVSTSPTMRILKGLGLVVSVEKETSSVCISLGVGTHEEYFAKLGKHAKQNVRTAYNRLARDGHQYRFMFLSRAGIGMPVDSCEGQTVLRQCERLYCDRQNSRYSKSVGFAAWRHWYLQRLLNYTTLARNSPDMMLACLFLDGQIAAFMQGYFNPDGLSIELPRLAIADKFGWYSPGLVMLNETAKFLISNTTVRGIDLCRGTEKYKFDMGGECYQTKTIKVSITKERMPA